MQNRALAKEIHTGLSSSGPKGMDLAQSLIHGYVGIARGIYGHKCIRFLADQTLAGVVTVENNSWVYIDAHGTRRVGGSLGDKVIRGVARIGSLLHKSPEASSIDTYEITEGLIDAARRVSFEINSQHRRIMFP